MKKRLMTLLLAVAVAVLMLPSTAMAATGMNVKYRTQAQIRDYVNSHPVSGAQKTTYSTVPGTSPYIPGQLSQSTQTGALNMLNRYRYIAGIDPAGLNGSYIKQAQAAAFLNAVLGVMTHNPARPAGMGSSLYQLGYTGAQHSNLAWGYRELTSAIKAGWISNSSNAVLGHRRWCLNPAMGHTGFGMAGNYSAMYAFDTSAGQRYNGVAWPAQNTPVGYFQSGDPWSFSTGRMESQGAVKVQLTRKNDGRKWIFTTSGGSCIVDNSGYGQPGCIIFRPGNVKVSSGTVYEVMISGLSYGSAVYTVKFFDLGSAQIVYGNKTPTKKNKVTKLNAATRVKAPTVKNLGSGAINIKYKGVKGAAGYKVTFSRNKNFKDSSTKSAVIKSKSANIVNLKKGKTYYIKVKAYKLSVSGSKIYGKYSKTKKITVKR